MMCAASSAWASRETSAGVSLTPAVSARIERNDMRALAEPFSRGRPLPRVPGEAMEQQDIRSGAVEVDPR